MSLLARRGTSFGRTRRVVLDNISRCTGYKLECAGDRTHFDAPHPHSQRSQLLIPQVSIPKFDVGVDNTSANTIGFPDWVVPGLWLSSIIKVRGSTLQCSSKYWYLREGLGRVPAAWTTYLEIAGDPAFRIGDAAAAGLDADLDAEPPLRPAAVQEDLFSDLVGVDRHGHRMATPRIQNDSATSS